MTTYSSAESTVQYMSVITTEL